jgi:hypothetical protein
MCDLILTSFSFFRAKMKNAGEPSPGTLRFSGQSGQPIATSGKGNQESYSAIAPGTPAAARMPRISISG